jgi:general stress protein 26
MPRRIRPRFPEEWHVPEDPKLWVTWSHANQKLRDEKVYWISTASSGGKPNATPVWGIWKSNTFYFESDPGSVKAKNIEENPRVIVHVQDGLDTVIMRGTAARERGQHELKKLRRDYVRKYEYDPDFSDESHHAAFMVKTRVVHAWKAPKLHRTLVKFLF